MMGRTGRILLVGLIGSVVGWLLLGPLHHGARRTAALLAVPDEDAVPATCREANPAWLELDLDLSGDAGTMAPGRVYRLSDGTLAVLVVVTEANPAGQAMALDFAASVRVAAVIVRAGTERVIYRLEPPERAGAGLTAPDRRAIDGIAFCYRIQVPGPPAPAPTPRPGETPTATEEPVTPAPTPTPGPTATATAEVFDLSGLQTAAALATEAADARATAAALATEAADLEVTRVAEATAAAATVAALATARAADVATATAAAAEQAAAWATVTAEAVTLATANAEREAALVTAQAAQTEAAATIAAMQTAAAQPTPTPTPTPVTVLYEARDGATFAAWPPAAGWRVEGDLLLADGSRFQDYLMPPYQAGALRDYAVEVEIQLSAPSECGRNFGIVLRGSEDGFYAGGVEWRCRPEQTVVALWAGQRELTSTPVALTGDWHTLRVEARGEQITVAIDGVVVTAIDAAYPVGGQIAIWSDGVEVRVRSIRVLAVQ